jgi:hypothetical protein
MGAEKADLEELFSQGHEHDSRLTVYFKGVEI